MKEVLKGGLSTTVSAAATGWDRIRPPTPGVVVLIYHRVGGGSPMPVDLPPAQFEDQIARVAPRAARLDDALALLGQRPAPSRSAVGRSGAGTSSSMANLRPGAESPASEGERGEVLPVVVTFDDGTADVVEQALPILVAHRVPMLLYVATRFVDHGIDFEFGSRAASWSSLADALSTGYLEIGSHTHSHALLDRISPQGVDDELDRSIGLIEDHLGVTPRHFAYPKALHGNAAARRAVRARFRSAAVAGTRPNVPGRTDPWTLARTPVQTVDHEQRFESKLAGGLGLEDDLRRLANRYRYRRLRS